VDYEEWNPAATMNFCRAVFRNAAGRKSANKLALQKELGLPRSADVPLFGTISRLAEQKGVDIQLGALQEMLSTEMQFVLLGSGSPAYERGYHELARRFPDKGGRACRLQRRLGASHRGRLRFLS
jgi:starch synthase